MVSAKDLNVCCRTIVLLLVFCSNNVYCQDFGYDGIEGPKYWGERYSQCVGKHQSPINIEEHNVENVNLLPMRFENFDMRPDVGELKNNGHTVILTLKSNGSQPLPIISGGPLLGRYQFVQLHFHWGADDNEGSENKINNSSYPMELHMVFFQSGYGSFRDAMEHPDGLTVLSFLYSNAHVENEKYRPIIDALPALQNSNTSKILDHQIPTFDDLIMANRTVYYTYGGSLTTPPCSEVVTWIEFINTIPLTHNQIEVFRHLKNEYGEMMSHNFRPTQPLYGRLIRLNADIDIDGLKYEKFRNSSPNLRIPSLFMILGFILCLTT